VVVGGVHKLELGCLITAIVYSEDSDDKCDHQIA
jgi:hypothetical protein